MEIVNHFSQPLAALIGEVEEPLHIKNFYGKWLGRLGNDDIEVVIKENGFGSVRLARGGMQMGFFELHLSGEKERPTLYAQNRLYSERGNNLLGEVRIEGELLNKNEMQVTQFRFWLFDRHAGGLGTLIKIN